MHDGRSGGDRVSPHDGVVFTWKADYYDSLAEPYCNIDANGTWYCQCLL